MSTYNSSICMPWRECSFELYSECANNLGVLVELGDDGESIAIAGCRGHFLRGKQAVVTCLAVNKQKGRRRRVTGRERPACHCTPQQKPMCPCAHVTGLTTVTCPISARFCLSLQRGLTGRRVWYHLQYLPASTSVPFILWLAILMSFTGVETKLLKKYRLDPKGALVICRSHSKFLMSRMYIVLFTSVHSVVYAARLYPRQMYLMYRCTYWRFQENAPSLCS